jgi:hypothetical protein
MSHARVGPTRFDIAGTMNRLMSHGSRLVSRRRMTTTIGAMMTRNRANH